ncbi:hypothetical protein ACS127_08405 [Amphibacillus sp. Q70]|uniref:hypothetical protein n=1 Tax=Amphibacillus sp. Q70 TaxID=3453416 RepID=UPI003F828666
MSPNNPEWLTEYPPEIFFGIKGPRIDAYAVALEGWRRGLKLKWYTKDAAAFKEMKTWFVDQPGQLFSLTDQSKEHFFFRTRGDLVSNKAVDIGADKSKTKTYLEKENVATPKGKKFDSHVSDQEIIDYAKKLGFPLVIKPTDDSFGRGITANIKDSTHFIEALNHTRYQQDYKNIIVEEHIEGDDYRLYVVGNQVVGAIHRTPPYVEGDGQSTISQLIKQKNKLRQKNPRLASCLIKIDQELIAFLKKQNRSLKTKPKKGEQVLLSYKNNISIGGDAKDKLDQLTDQVKSIAIEAVKAIPELNHCGVDMIIDQEQNRAVVIEVNATAHIGSLLFPGQGKARDIPKAIVDYYFPESIEADRHNVPIYFSFKEEIRVLNNASLQSVTITEPPLGKLIKTNYRLKGKVSSRRYQESIKKQVLSQIDLNGFIVNKSRQEIEIVVATNNRQSLAEFESFLENLSDKVNVQKLAKVDDHQPVKLGFSIIGKDNLVKKFKRKSYQYRILRWILKGFEILNTIFQLIILRINKRKNKTK